MTLFTAESNATRRGLAAGKEHLGTGGGKHRLELRKKCVGT